MATENKSKRFTKRKIYACIASLNRSLAGEPESDDEDTEGMEMAKAALFEMLRQRAKKSIRTSQRESDGDPR